jgi:hypothetical protein
VVRAEALVHINPGGRGGWISEAIGSLVLAGALLEVVVTAEGMSTFVGETVRHAEHAYIYIYIPRTSKGMSGELGHAELSCPFLSGGRKSLGGRGAVRGVITWAAHGPHLNGDG